MGMEKYILTNILISENKNWATEIKEIKMLIPKTNRIAIYEALFKDGVMVASKDCNKPKHDQLDTIPNLHVVKAMTSLKSRGYVRENFAWRHFYWYLTNEGIQYLRDYLHLPPEIVPATLRKATKPAGESRPWNQRDQRGGPPRDRDGGDRDSYRREGSGDARMDKGGAGDNFKPEFRGGMGGIGRGRGGPPSGGFGAPPPTNTGGFGAPPS